MRQPRSECDAYGLSPSIHALDSGMMLCTHPSDDVPILATDRDELYLKFLTTSDISDVTLLLGLCHQSLSVWEPGLLERYQDPYLLREELLCNGRGCVRFGIFTRSVLVGVIMAEWHQYMALVNISYYVEPGHWGRGIASSATRTFVAYLHEKLNLRRVIGRARTHNVASCRVLQKAGFSEIETREPYTRRFVHILQTR